MSGSRRESNLITGFQHQNRKTVQNGKRNTTAGTVENRLIPLVYSFDRQRLSPTQIKTQLSLHFDPHYNKKEVDG